MSALTVGVSAQDCDHAKAVIAADARLVPWSEPHRLDAVWRRAGDSVADLVAAVERAPDVKWVHTDTIGVDRFPLAEWRRRGIRVTTGRGLSTVQVAEWTLTAMLIASRRSDESVRLSDSRVWGTPPGIRTLADQHVVILGLGAIGRHVAKLARAFGASVTGVVRSTPDAGDERHSQVDLLLGSADLARACAGASLLVLCAPATAQSRRIVDAEIIAHLQPGAWVINGARGELIDEPALVAAVETGQLGGAVLDVTAQEPPPAQSPLWQHPRIILTGHTADHPRATPTTAALLFASRLRDVAAGRPFSIEVDLERGY